MNAATANAVAAGSGSNERIVCTSSSVYAYDSFASVAPGSMAVSRAGFSPLEVVKLLRQSENPAHDTLDVPKGIAAQLPRLADLRRPLPHDTGLRVLQPLLTAERLQVALANVLCESKTQALARGPLTGWNQSARDSHSRRYRTSSGHLLYQRS